MDEPESYEERQPDEETQDKGETSLVGGFIDGYWADASSLYMVHKAPASNPGNRSLKLVAAGSGSAETVFASWTETSDSGEQLNVMAYRNSPSGSGWNGPGGSNYTPVGIGADATATMFHVNRENRGGYALWGANANLNLSEYMGGMGHFMGSTVTVDDGHVPQFVVKSDAGAYLITQVHMSNGFGLNAFTRTSFGSWSTPVPLHRMGMDAANAMNMPHDSLASLADGNDNVRAIWIETQAGVTRLMTALYDTGNNTWGSADTILDSSNTFGVDLSAIVSISASGETGTANIHVALAQDTAADESVYTLDFDGTAWGEPVRRDNDMNGMGSMTVLPEFAVNADHHVVAWVEDHGSMITVDSIRYIPGTGWSTEVNLAAPDAGAGIDYLTLDVNAAGDTVAVWRETSATAIRIGTSLQASDGAWADKEMVLDLAANEVIHMPAVTMRSDRTPWIVWLRETNANGMTMFELQESKRLADITDVDDVGGIPSNPDPDPTDPGPNPTDPDPTDPAPVNPIVEQGTDYVSGYWGPAAQRATEHVMSADNPQLISQQLKVVPGGQESSTGPQVFHNWSVATNAGEVLKVDRATYGETNGYEWLATPQQPAGISASATMTQFVPDTGTQGYALWDDAGTVKVSEFMEMSGMAHFMGTADIGAGHAARILVEGSSAYIVMQSHMANGFGLDVYKRTAQNSWSGAVQLHRMGMDAANAMAMSHDALKTLIDGQGNLRAVWIETQGANTRVMTAVYNTTDDSWGTVSPILDSAGDTHGIDLTTIGSMSISAEHANANAHLVLYVDTTTDEAIYTLDFDGMAWAHPMRRDMDMGGMASIVVAPQYDVYHDTHQAVWVENHMDTVMIKSLRFASGSWNTVEDISSPAGTATIAQLDVKLNHAGDAVVYWVESDASGVRLLNTLRPAAGVWAMKELVSSFAAATVINNVTATLHDNGTPWIVWNEESSMNGMTMFTLGLAKRGADLTDTQPAGTTPTDPNPGDPNSGDPNPGDPGTADPVIEPGTDYVAGYWGGTSQLFMEHVDPAGNPHIASQKLQVVDTDTVFFSWTVATDTGEMLKVRRASNDASNGYTWTLPLDPIGISATATMTQFIAKTGMEGYALWDDAGTVKVSEFMEMSGMAHFMGTADIGAGHAARILVEGSSTYIVMQSHMTGGFGLDVYKRTGPSTWSGPVQLHRMSMDANNPMAMSHQALSTLIDGQGMLRAVWVETQGMDTRFMTAVYNITDDTWDVATPILDTATNTHGVELASIASMSLSAEHINANIHIALFVDTAADEAVYTMDFDGTTWSMPMRRDMDMSGMAHITSVAQYAVYHDTHQVAWVEDHMGMVMIKSLRFMPVTGWVLEDIAMPAMGAGIAQLGVKVNHDGDALAYWTETDTGGIRVLNALRPVAGTWAMKEMVASFAAGATVHNVEGALHHNGTPWIVWNETASMSSMTMFTSELVQRLADITDTTPAGTDPGNPDPGVTPVVEPDTDYVSGYWGGGSQLFMEHTSPADNPRIASQSLQRVDTDTVFYSWAMATDTGEVLKVRRALNDPAAGYSWTGPLVPVGVSATAVLTQFTANTGTQGYALWDDAGIIKVSEFMEMAGVPHFMGTTTIGDGHAARIVTGASTVYLLTQSHMANGFGLDVYKRTGQGAWDPVVQLHRMGMDAANAMAMSHDALQTIIDGQNNIRALWIETQASDTRVMTAVYDTSNDTWGAATAVLDSAGNSHGIDLASIASYSVSTEHGNANAHLALFEDTAADEAVYTMDLTATTWSMPVRRDMDMNGMASITNGVQYAVFHDSQLVAWVEDHMGAVMIKSLRFTPAEGWTAVQDIAMPASGASISQLGVKLNHTGDALAYWAETDSGGMRILNALRPLAGPWAMKELVAAFAAGFDIYNLIGVLHDNGTPWIVWNESSGTSTMSMFTAHLVQRAVDMSNTTAAGTPPSNPTDPNPTDPNPTDPNPTDPNPTDPNPNDPTVPADQSVVSGLWDTAGAVTAENYMVADEAVIAEPSIQVTQSGDIFLSWVSQSMPDVTTLAYTQSDITVMRAQADGGGAYIWSDPASSMFNPVGYNNAATDTQFIVNPTSGDGFAVWSHNAATHTSEFMSSMGHFMGSAQLAEGHATKVLVDSTGQTYLLTQSHMTGGFGLSVYERTAADQWSAIPVQLHRMDMANAFNMVNHFLIATVDGQDNIRAVWLEEQGGVLSLQTATYDTAATSWGMVSAIAHGDIVLNRLSSGIANGKATGADLQLVLHTQNGMMHEIFEVTYTEATAWVLPTRLDTQTATSMITMAPAFAVNTAGHITVAWVEMDSAMAASNSSGAMNTVKARQYMPGMGWHATEMVTHAYTYAEVSTLDVNLNAAGEASIVWVESTADNSNILSSHKIAMSANWSQRELIAQVPNADGHVQSVSTELGASNIPLTVWVVGHTDGMNETLALFRNFRSTAIVDAVPSNVDPTPVDPAPTDPVPTDPGTTDPVAGGKDIPVNTEWTTPVMAAGMLHSTSRFRMYGPQVVMDDVGNTAIRLSMANLKRREGTSLTTINNQVIYSVDNSNWDNILMGSSLMDDLSNTAVIESIKAIPTTGLLYAMIRDDETLYLARYEGSAWTKMEVPGVEAEGSARTRQLTTDDTGMVTITWNDEEGGIAYIHAKHHMQTTGWQATETLAVAAQSIVTPHIVDTDGKVHVAWLVDNTNTTVGGFNMKMATFTPMQGWSAATDGPTGLRSTLAKAHNAGNNKVVVVTDTSMNSINAYIFDVDGSWITYGNINDKASNDGVKLTRHSDVQLVGGGQDHFMVAWREYTVSGTILSPTRYKTVMIHNMTDTASGMAMWHLDNPSEVGGINAERESHLQYVLDTSGNAYAVWTGVNTADASDNVYVNSAAMGAVWGTEPKPLASYDMTAGNYAGRVSITINALGNIGVAWDQHISASSMAMHRVWFVENAQ